MSVLSMVPLKASLCAPIAVVLTGSAVCAFEVHATAALLSKTVISVFVKFSALFVSGFCPLRFLSKLAFSLAISSFVKTVRSFLTSP